MENIQNVKVTYLTRYDDTTPKQRTLEAAIKAIGDDTYKEKIGYLRGLDSDTYKLKKKHLPAFIFNGTFNGEATNINFKQSSGLFLFDIDGLEASTLESDKATLGNLPSTVFCFVSPSGHGLKGALRIEHDLVKNDADFKRVYNHAEKMIKDVGYKLDKSCKDVRRLCFVSYDPKIYVNYDAEIFPIPGVVLQIKPVQPKKPKQKALAPANNSQQQQAFDTGKESILIDRCLSILSTATSGNRHGARLRAGKLAGGYIAGGLINEQKITDLLAQASDNIADSGSTNEAEQKTLLDSIQHGKLTPIYDGAIGFEIDESSEYSIIINETLEKLDDDKAAWVTDKFKEALLAVYFSNQQEFERIYYKLQKWKIATFVKAEIKRMAKKHYNTKKAAPKQTATDKKETEISIKNPIKWGALVFTHPESGEQSLIVQSEGAVIVAACLRDTVAYSRQALTWHTFTGAYWQQLSTPGLIDSALIDLMYTGAGDVGFTNSYKNNVKALIADGDFLPIPAAQVGLLPFKNGLLDYKTRKLYPITPRTAQTWSLPFDYDVKADCQNIKAWLLQAVDGDKAAVSFLRAWLAALLHGRSDLQKFLHIIGSGGTGKGTFMRLATALVGNHNAASTSLKEMETNRFEPARFYEKRLVMITDSDKYGGSINTLKAMTGQDYLRIERKHQQQTGDFIYEGLVMMASNENLATTDHTSGLDRRRSMVVFDRRATDEEKRDWEILGGEAVVLHSEISGLVNWLLELSQDDITQLIRTPPASTKQANFDAMTSANPIAEWITDCLYPDLNEWLQIGDKREIRNSGIETTFEKSNEWLYPNYLTWSQRHNRQALSVIRFKAVVIDTLKTFKVDFKTHKKPIGSGFLGVRFRKEWEGIYPGWQPESS